MEKTCLICSNVFSTKVYNKKFCSHDCLLAHRRNTQNKPKKENNCEQCGRYFKSSVANKKFCSSECKIESYYKEYTCCMCNNIFKSKHPDRFICSPKCMGEYLKREVELTCDNCGDVFKRNASKAKNKDLNFCTFSCSLEHKRKNTGEQSFKWSSVEVGCEQCGNKVIRQQNQLKVRKNAFCSSDCYANWRSENLNGENSPSWNHDLSQKEREIGRKYTDYYLWRTKVYERDEYTCQVCKVKGSILHAHHLDGYHWCKEKRTDVDNGVTLCSYCHDDFHSIFGRTNNTRQQYEEWIVNKKRKTS